MADEDEDEIKERQMRNIFFSFLIPESCSLVFKTILIVVRVFFSKNLRTDQKKRTNMYKILRGICEKNVKQIRNPPRQISSGFTQKQKYRTSRRQPHCTNSVIP